MFQQLFSSESACRRHGDAPFADERERYLQHCAEQGSTHATLRVKANELLWLAQHLESNASDGVNMEALQDIVRERQFVCHDERLLTRERTNRRGPCEPRRRFKSRRARQGQ